MSAVQQSQMDYGMADSGERGDRLILPRSGILLIVLAAAIIGLRLDAALVTVLQSLPRFVSSGADRLEPFGHWLLMAAE
jgi:hypothetical protein